MTESTKEEIALMLRIGTMVSGMMDTLGIASAIFDVSPVEPRTDRWRVRLAWGSFEVTQFTPNEDVWYATVMHACEAPHQMDIPFARELSATLRMGFVCTIDFALTTRAGLAEMPTQGHA